MIRNMLFFKGLDKNRILILCCLFFAPGIVLPNHVSAADSIRLRAVTSSFAPLQMYLNGKPDGYAIRIVDLVTKKVSAKINQKIELEFEFLPGKRGFRAATANEENILFFSLSRSPKREAQFHWIGEISPYDMHLFTLNPELAVKLPSLAAIRDSDKIIGVQGGSNVEELLRSHNFAEGRDFVTYADYREGIKMLYRQRVDFIPMTSFLARGNVCGENLDTELLVKSLRLDSISQPLWLVFSKSTDTGLVRHFSNVLKTFNTSDEYLKVTETYIDRWTKRICGNHS